MTVEISFVDVSLVDKVTFCGSKCNKCPDRGKFGNGCKSLFVVNTLALTEALGNESSFELGDFTMFVSFRLEYESRAQHFCVFR